MFSEKEKLLQAVKYIRDECNLKDPPEIGIVCGSGLGKLAEALVQPQSIVYSSIPHFVASTVVGHCGELIFGTTKGVKIVCMRGRVHLYEGYDVADCIRPIRVMAMLGVKVLVVTNAAGTVNDHFEPGDFMIIKDHLSFPALSGENPLRGPHDKLFGDRFVTMSNAYNTKLIATLETVSRNNNFELKKGVYAMVSGPTYETIAEARLLRMMGADCVGMSTAHEVIAAHQMGVKCLGISLLTNRIVKDYDSVDDCVDHLQVVEMASKRANDFVKIIIGFIDAVKQDLPQIESRKLPHQQINGSTATTKLNGLNHKLTNLPHILNGGINGKLAG